MNHILVITGSYPPEICGVGDYTKNLMTSATGNNWKLYHRGDWRLGMLFAIIKDINLSKPREIFMQYPTQGYGWSLVPQLLCLYYSLFSTIRFTVVLHEFSQLSKKAKLAARLLLASANQIIFTNDFERIAATKFLQSVGARSRTVKIVSNISASENSMAPKDSRPLDLAYFGHVRPKKGIETFIETVREIRKTNSCLKIALIGQCPPGFENYTEQQLAICKSLRVDLMLDLPSDRVSQALSCVKVVYLPFPDGISERRGTALAAMANGALVLTTTGLHTTDELGQAVSLVSTEVTPLAVALQLQEIIALPESAMQGLRSRAHAYLCQHIPQSWDDVAQSYVERL